MYLHVVMLALDPKADAAFFDTVQGFCDRVRNECDGVIAYAFRANEADRAQGYTHATVCAFSDAAAHDAYQISPAHVAMKAYMTPFITQLAVFDGAVAVQRSIG